MRRALVFLCLVMLFWAGACAPATEPQAANTDGEERSYSSALGRTFRGGFLDRTRGDMQAIGVALASRMADQGSYPLSTDMSGLAAALEPRYIRTLPRADAWGRPFRYESGGSGFRLISSGPGGSAGDEDDVILTEAGFR